MSFVCVNPKGGGVKKVVLLGGAHHKVANRFFLRKLHAINIVLKFLL